MSTARTNRRDRLSDHDVAVPGDPVRASRRLHSGPSRAGRRRSRLKSPLAARPGPPRYDLIVLSRRPAPLVTRRSPGLEAADDVGPRASRDRRRRAARLAGSRGPRAGTPTRCVRQSRPAIASVRWFDREADGSPQCSRALALARSASAPAFAVERAGRGLIGACLAERTAARPTRVHRTRTRRARA